MICMGAQLSPSSLVLTGYMGSGSLTSPSKRYIITVELSRDKLFMESGYWAARAPESDKATCEGKATSTFDAQTDSMTITLRDNDLKSSALLTLVKPNYCPDAFDTGFLFIKKDPTLIDNWLTELSPSLDKAKADPQSLEKFWELRYQLLEPATIGNIADVNDYFFNKYFGTPIDFVYLTTAAIPPANLYY